MSYLIDVTLMIAGSWIVLFIFAAFLNAVVEFIDEWLLSRYKTDDADAEEEEEEEAVGTLAIISGIFGAVISLAFLIISFIWSDIELYTGPVDAAKAFAAGSMEIIWLIPYLYAVNRSGALNAAPLFQAIPIFALVLGLAFYGEVPTLTHLIAGALIVGGGFTLNYSLSDKKFELGTVGLMFLASALVALEYFFFKDAAVEGNFFAAAFWMGFGMVAVSIFLYMFIKPYRQQFNEFLKTDAKNDAAIQAGNEGLNGLSVIASSFAVVRAPGVAIASAFNAFHPVFTLLIALFLSKRGSEEHKIDLSGGELLKTTLAILVIALGTAVIAF